MLSLVNLIIWFWPFQGFSFHLPSPSKLEDWYFRINIRLFSFSSYKLLKSLQYAVVNRIERGYLVGFFLEILSVTSFTNSSARFSEFDSRNLILFQNIFFGRNIKETTLVRYFIKVTACPSFTRLRVISWIIEFIKYQNGKYLAKIQLCLLLI